MTKEQMAQEALIAWSKQNDVVTTLELKNYLRSNYPQEVWNQQWVSAFLSNSDMDYEMELNSNGDLYRVYAVEPTLDLDLMQGICADLMVNGQQITKSKMKSMIRLLGVPTDGFKDLFNQLGLTHTGKYTSDNHRVYTYVPAGQHFSKSKQQTIAIKDMPKPYLRNAIFQLLFDDLGFDEDDIREDFDDTNSELFKLLQAYFTFDIRKSVNSI